jgi:hypothetical protein
MQLRAVRYTQFGEFSECQLIRLCGLEDPFLVRDAVADVVVTSPRSRLGSLTPCNVSWMYNVSFSSTA